MDGVLPRTPTGRPRIAAVGAILVLCLLAAPLMSLFPVAVWDLTHTLTTGGAGYESLLVAPVAVGGILLILLLSGYWLMSAGVTRPASCASLVVGVSMATPVVMGFLAPAFTPLPGGLVANIAAVSALLSTAALGVCVLSNRPEGRRQPGVLPGVAVAVAALLVLPLASEHMRGRFTEQRSLAQINGFEYTIAVLDSPRWVPVRVHEVHDGLRMTYVRDGGAEGAPDAGGLDGTDPGDEPEPDGGEGAAAVHVLSWTRARAAEGIRDDCGFPGVECSQEEGLLAVYRGSDGREGSGLSEVRARLDDGTVASVHPAGSLPPDQLFTVARFLRAEHPGERDALVDAVLRR
ncbi:hypothetical protein ACWFMI_22185 [Nocardiopsis terrae]